MEQIDARGQACPLPVVRAKKALSSMEEGLLEVLVDNTTAVKNLESLAKTLKIEVTSKNRGQSGSGCEYAVIFAKGAAKNVPPIGEKPLSPAAKPHKDASCSARGSVVVISSEYMGAKDGTLGASLMKSFVFALTQLDTLPKALLLYNSGVKLACESSALLDDLKVLAQAGVDIMSCGACLDYYKLAGKLAVGRVTNMYEIVEAQTNARVVIRP